MLFVNITFVKKKHSSWNCVQLKLSLMWCHYVEDQWANAYEFLVGNGTGSQIFLLSKGWMKFFETVDVKFKQQWTTTNPTCYLC